MTRFQLLCRTALPLLAMLPAAAYAQQASEPLGSDIAVAGEVAFSADTVSYDTGNEIVTASGEVRMANEGNRLAADRLVWDRDTGEVRAEGNVRIETPQGDTAYGDSIVLTDSLRDGVVDNLLVVLDDGGRLAAERGERRDGFSYLERAAYSPCAVVSPEGCPKDPTWQITAVRVVHDPVRGRISYQGASLRLFGVPVIALPGLSHPDGGEGGGGSGLLMPDVRISRSNGLELSVPYYFRLAPNRDLTIAPHVFTQVLPMIEARYRQLTELGAFQVSGYLTHGSSLPVNADFTVADRERGIRAYLEGNGKFQLDPLWSITASGRYVTDRTFLRRYDISTDDRLRSVINAERIAENSYISIAGWAFQGLRATDDAGQQPFALPMIDARFRLPDPVWGGRVELQANSLAITRTEGQDTQRAFASARWDRRSITPGGQEVVLTAFGRGDLYHTDQVESTPTLIYRGDEGWSGRGIAAAAAEIRWPLIGPLGGGTQRLTPRIQVVVSPPTENIDIPNEDARAVDLEDSNLFALNRFPGYDRWEDGARVTYGADWALDLPGIAVRTTVGQSYRLNREPSLLPQGTGLSDRFSDVVGRTDVDFGRTFSLTHRFRLDKDNAAIRRNEIDAVWGGRRTYGTIGYLRLNRNVDASIEDLRDREEVRVGGRVAFARFWSVFGSAVVDLTNRDEDPFTGADGFQPIRHRLGVGYSDECIELGLTWRRDYESTGDFRRGNSFLFRVALKNLGR